MASAPKNGIGTLFRGPTENAIQLRMGGAQQTEIVRNKETVPCRATRWVQPVAYQGKQLNKWQPGEGMARWMRIAHGKEKKKGKPCKAVRNHPNLAT